MIDIKQNGRVDARQLHTKLEIKTRFNDWIEDVIDRIGLWEGQDYFRFLGKTTAKGGCPPKECDLTLSASILACFIGSGKASTQIYKHLSSLNGREVVIQKKTRKELLFEINLNEIFDGITKVIAQYPVLRYRVDFFLPELNIAIEYDEAHHKYKKQQDIKREQEIMGFLNCKIIRVAEGEEQKGVNQILKHMAERFE